MRLLRPEGKGGGYVLNQNPDRVRCLAVADNRELMDVDTPRQLAQLQAELERGYD